MTNIEPTVGHEADTIGHVAAKSRLIRLPEVKSRVGLSRSSIYHRMNEGTFPRSRSLGAKCAVWVEAEIEEWINSVASL
jgi:prophage regulatory protein